MWPDGDFLTIWQNIQSIWQLFEGLFFNSWNYEPTLSNFKLLGKFSLLYWPNFEQTIKPSGHTANYPPLPYPYQTPSSSVTRCIIRRTEERRKRWAHFWAFQDVVVVCLKTFFLLIKIFVTYKVNLDPSPSSSHDSLRFAKLQITD